MKLSRMRRLAALLTLVCAATQPAAGSALLASALTLGLHGSPHAHSVSIVAEEGHLHLVLSHDEGAHRDRGRALNHYGPSFAESDHVFHMTGEDAAGVSPRRAALDQTPPLSMVVALPSAPMPTWDGRPSPELRVRSSDLLRTVALRL